jgi:transcriptional regulator with XRE-family HTH domain
MTLEGGATLERMNFRGLVYSRYKTIAEFAQVIGWTRQKATNIVNGLQEPSLDDTDKMAKALNLSLEETARFFLPAKSQV